VRLAYTPRKCALLKDSGALVLIETDHNAEKAVAKHFKMTNVPEAAAPEVNHSEGEGLSPYQSFGVQRAGEGKWASCIRVHKHTHTRTHTHTHIHTPHTLTICMYVCVCVCVYVCVCVSLCV
jgi:hypothetical protein